MKNYEILKSRESELNKYHKKFVIYHVTELRHILMADNYKFYKDFRVKVFDYAIEEINEYSDLQVTYEEIPLKTGKRGKPPKIREWKEKSDMLENQNMELSKALELLSKQHALELEKLQLSLEKKFQEEKQKEVDKYQQKYFELLESLKKTPNNKKTVSSSKEKKEQ